MKAVLFSALRGLLAGMALNSAICLVSSYALHLGYYAPCFVALTEPCGGELNAALVQTCAFALVGALLGVLGRILARRFRHESAR